LYLLTSQQYRNKNDAPTTESAGLRTINNSLTTTKDLLNKSRQLRAQVASLRKSSGNSNHCDDDNDMMMTVDDVPTMDVGEAGQNGPGSYQYVQRIDMSTLRFFLKSI